MRRIFTQIWRSSLNLVQTIEETPIIILGNQKSGTSAIAHLLAYYGGLSNTIDITVLWPPIGVEIVQGKKQFAQIVQKQKSYFSTKVIKEPMMTFFSNQVLEVFPNGQYIFVVRDPRDNIRSLLNSRNIPGNLDVLREDYIPDFPQHAVIADATVWGGNDENYIGVLAHRWNKAVDNYLAHVDRMKLVKYENFLADKLACIQQLAEKLGIPIKHDITTKLNVQYQPRGNHKITLNEFFGEDNLARINQICDSRMKRLGYSVV